MQLHRSYVLRCMPVKGPEDEPAWRFSIQEAAPEARRHAFNTIGELLVFLNEELGRTRRETELER